MNHEWDDNWRWDWSYMYRELVRLELVTKYEIDATDNSFIAGWCNQYLKSRGL